jgi:hypothetical protein
VKLKSIKESEQQNSATSWVLSVNSMNVLTVCKSIFNVSSFTCSICNTVKKLQFRSHELADDYYGIGAEINHFAEMLSVAEIPQITNFYKRLGDMMIKNGDFILHTGELTN